MLDIKDILTSNLKRQLFIKKVLRKVLKRDIFTLYENKSYKKIRSKKLKSFISIKYLKTEGYDLELIEYLEHQYLDHRFEILGSGWKDASTVLSEPNKENKEYRPINWNIDLKTGYVFSNDKIYKPESLAELPNYVDVKVCWDLARMHHLVLLSIFSLINKNQSNIIEFKNQVYDFYENNPTGYGINWCGSMEASIRAINLLIAHDIFKQIDEENLLDLEFEKMFSSMIYQHGRFIIKNLEGDLLYGKNHNHYLSNIVGLLYISAYLNEKSNKYWWDFAQKEFYKEIEKQFYDDGTNFEGSTSYHRFSGEMLVFGLAIIKRIDGYIPKTASEKLWKAAYFSKTITKSSNKVVQIGDNDSGRLLKFTMYGELISTSDACGKYLNLKNCTNVEDFSQYYFDEDFLNHDSFIAYVSGLLDSPEFSSEKQKYKLEHSVINCIAQSYEKDYNWELPHFKKNVVKNIDESILSNKILTTLQFRDNDNLEKNGKWISFSEFGLHCFKSEYLEVFIYSGRSKKNGINSHIHNDKLHFELCVNGKEYFNDPGTGVYTSDIKCRNMFRSYKFHNTPDYGVNFDEEKSVFSVNEKSICFVGDITDNSISLILQTNNITHLRKLVIEERFIKVEDYGNRKFEVILKEAEYFSNGYGKIEKTKQTRNDIVIKQSK